MASNSGSISWQIFLFPLMVILAIGTQQEVSAQNTTAYSYPSNRAASLLVKSRELQKVNLDSALKYAALGLQKLQLSPETGSDTAFKQLKADLLLQGGITHNLVGNIDESLEHLNQAASIFSEVGDSVKLSDALEQISLMGSQGGTVIPWEPLMTRVLNIRLKAGDSLRIARTYNSMGFAYLVEDQLKQSDSVLFLALSLANRLGYTQEEGLANQFLCSSMRKQGRISEAIDYIEKGTAQAEEIGDAFNLMTAYRRKYSIHFGQKDYPRALLALQKAIAVGKAAGISRVVPYLNRFLSSLYAELGSIHETTNRERRKELIGAQFTLEFGRVPELKEHAK